jgi:hypothetical protein
MLLATTKLVDSFQYIHALPFYKLALYFACDVTLSVYPHRAVPSISM